MGRNVERREKEFNQRNQKKIRTRKKLSFPIQDLRRILVLTLTKRSLKMLIERIRTKNPRRIFYQVKILVLRVLMGQVLMHSWRFIPWYLYFPLRLRRNQ